MKELKSFCIWLKSSNTEKELIKKSILFTILFSLAANGFAYLNLMPQHDAINHTLSFAGNWELSLGRWLLPSYGKLKGNISIPWITGIGSAFLIALIVIIVCKILEFESNYEILLISGFLSANASITELNSTFQYVLDVFMLSAALSAIGAYLLIKNNSMKSIILASILFTVSMGLYQGEIVIALIILLFNILKKAIENTPFQNQLKSWGRYLIALGIAAVLYYILYKTFLKINAIQPADSYNSLSRLKALSIMGIIHSVEENIISFLVFFFGKECFIGRICRIANIALALLCITILGTILLTKKISGINKLISLFCILAMPIAATFITVLMNQNKIRFYVSYAIFLLYPMMLFILSIRKNELKGNKKIKYIELFAFAFSILVISENIRYSNSAYSIQKLTYDRTESLMTQILYDLNQQDEYIPGKTEVIVLGSFGQNTYISTLSNNYNRFHAFNKLSITYTMTLKSFSRLLGLEINYVDDPEIIEPYHNLKEVKQMPAFPVKGYIITVNDRVILKLSD